MLDVAVEYIKRHRDVAAKIYVGYEDDFKTINAVGGTIRAAYLNGKRQTDWRSVPLVRGSKASILRA